MVATIGSNRALIQQSEKKIAQITADYRRQLQTERVETAAQLEKAAQELAKNEHRHELLELRAPAEGIVKDLATHTIGTVAAPGTILVTLAGGSAKFTSARARCSSTCYPRCRKPSTKRRGSASRALAERGSLRARAGRGLRRPCAGWCGRSRTCCRT